MCADEPDMIKTSEVFPIKLSGVGAGADGGGGAGIGCRYCNVGYTELIKRR